MTTMKFGIPEVVALQRILGLPWIWRQNMQTIFRESTIITLATTHVINKSNERMKKQWYPHIKIEQLLEKLKIYRRLQNSYK